MLLNRLEKRPALVARKLERYKIDGSALQETFTENKGELTERSQALFWISKNTDKRREPGVGFAIVSTLVKKFFLLSVGVSYHLVMLRTMNEDHFATLVLPYAPTMTYPHNKQTGVL